MKQIEAMQLLINLKQQTDIIQKNASKDDRDDEITSDEQILIYVQEVKKELAVSLMKDIHDIKTIYSMAIALLKIVEKEVFENDL